MWIKQMTISDWLEMFRERPETMSQVDTIEERRRKQLPLATWEQNCLRAYQILYKVAAE